MTRIDENLTEADFIAFEFATPESADKAEKAFPADFVRSTGTTVEYRAMSLIPGIRKKLEAAGLSWSESESSITEEDMWPEWPEDGDDSRMAP